MGVPVNETRGYNMAFGVNRLFGRFAINTANFCYFAVFYTNVTSITNAARPVDDHAILDHEIVAHLFPLFPKAWIQYSNNCASCDRCRPILSETIIANSISEALFCNTLIRRKLFAGRWFGHSRPDSVL